MTKQELKEAEDKCFWEGSFSTVAEELPDEYCQVTVSDNILRVHLFGMEKGNALKTFNRVFKKESQPPQEEK